MQTSTGKQTAAVMPGGNAGAKPLKLQKQIGSVVYEVEIHFNPGTKERMNDKILRLIQRDMEAAA